MGSDARAFAQELSKALGQQVYVENRPGAGSTIGAEAGAKATPDGYTLVQTVSALYGVAPLVYPKLGYDVVKDLRSVIVLTSFDNVLVVNSTLPVTSMKELIAYAKGKPGEVTFASSGNGTTTHMSGEMFKQMAHIDIRHVPYKSGAPATTDVLGGQVNMMFHNIPSVIQHIKSATLRALAVTGAQRSQFLPDVPTVAEAGLSGYQSSGWFSMSVPAATPQAVIDRLSKASMEAVKSRGFVKSMNESGFDVVGGTPQQMDAMVQDEIRRWAPIVKSSGVRVD
ncbi:tripartite tricarboxylate transporter substrate binding protein [Pantoea sp. 18069]|uniref:tripartite tricarboxylate transporter substrate binding protein n=1 Tax=Pantoea sp. 18069 TaxID=2681415 RepID=UPI00135C621C|nr:tripartite tricarboxylate transporter substrate binding protein [Pantoea sp. 18069]